MGLQILMRSALELPVIILGFRSMPALFGQMEPDPLRSLPKVQEGELPRGSV